MNKGKYVFSQLLDCLDRNGFNYLARKYDGDKYAKHLTCYNQLAVLMFGQLSNCDSLRDVVLATQAHAAKAVHLGFGRHVSKSTLAEDNSKRDCRIFVYDGHSSEKDGNQKVNLRDASNSKYLTGRYHPSSRPVCCT